MSMIQMVVALRSVVQHSECDYPFDLSLSFPPRRGSITRRVWDWLHFSRGFGFIPHDIRVGHRHPQLFDAFQ